MKRSAALAPLSRDHHHALVVARELSRCDEATAGAAADRFTAFLSEHELKHFAVEEQVLLPAIPPDEAARALAQEMLDDHEYLRTQCSRVRAGEVTPGLLHEIGARLRAHVQMEERRLFPYLEEALDADALAAIGARLQQEAG